MKALVVCAIACAACGDNTLPAGAPLVPGAALTILAHQDDDLLFMQPDLLDAVVARRGVTNVYVTAGNGTKGVAYVESREEGLRAAYAAAAGDALTDWTCGWITIAGHAANHCRLADARVSLVFLGYPDGGKAGEQPSSLLHLWEGTITTATTVARRTASYDQAGLVATLAEIIGDTQPAELRTLDVAATHGRDHSDHMIVGALALLGAAAAGSPAAITSYRGYDVADEPADTDPTLVARSTTVVQHYDACVDGCAPCGEPCSTFDPSHAIWIARRYAIGLRGRLHGAQIYSVDHDQCLAMDAGGAVRLADCATAPTWDLTVGGALQSGDHCVQRLPTGELVAATCDPAAVAPPAQRWFVDEEGHVWAGVAPIPVAAMDYAHLDCLAAAGPNAKVHTDLCGEGHAPTWAALAPVATTAIAGLGTDAAALGDLDGDGAADLAAVSAGRLVVARGAGDGTFAGSAADVAALPVAPASLALGDLDGDGRADACGRGATGVTCLVGGAAVAWTADLGSAADPLAIVGGQVCGVTADGVACAARGGSAHLVATTGAAALAGDAADLDGDGAPDGCVALAAGSGVACALAADRALAPSVAPWSYALGGVVDSGAGAARSVALADVDGDGRADSCELDAAGARVTCARSAGHGFGPRFTALRGAPAGGALALGDLDGDGRADVCVIAAGQVTCALSP